MEMDEDIEEYVEEGRKRRISKPIEATINMGPCLCLCLLCICCIASMIIILVMAFIIVGELEDQFGRSTSHTKVSPFPIFQTLLFDSDHNITAYGLSSYKHLSLDGKYTYEENSKEYGDGKYIYERGLSALYVNIRCYCLSPHQDFGTIRRIIVAENDGSDAEEKANAFKGHFCFQTFPDFSTCSSSNQREDIMGEIEYISKVEDEKMEYFCKGRCETLSTSIPLEQKELGCHRINHQGVVSVDCPDNDRRNCDYYQAQRKFAMHVLDPHCRDNRQMYSNFKETCYAYDESKGVKNSTIYCREVYS